ncbi:hypothetical protein [Lacticaseibacillus sp. N501-2]|uniref:GHMP family kinase ATP-binding protein n=1 Tax=Lacticaseibacillus salsurae TaxID=3367729 RepID=UPI0038B2F96D
MRIHVPGVITSRSPLGQNLATAITAGLNIDVEEESLDWQVDHAEAKLAHDQSNMIVSVADSVAPGLLPHRLVLTTDLPVGAGLGGSNAATLAGIMLADQLANLHLSEAQIIQTALGYEPYPAGLQAALHGGMQTYDPRTERLERQTVEPLQWVIYLPDHFSEASVPSHYLGQNINPADYARFTKALAKADDNYLRSHLPLEPLQTQVTPEYFPQAEMVNRAVMQCGGYGCFVAGNGPALVCLAPVKAIRFVDLLHRSLTAGQLLVTDIDATGTTIN